MPRHHPKAEDARAAPGMAAAGEGFSSAGRPLPLRHGAETALFGGTGRRKRSLPGIGFFGPAADFASRLDALARLKVLRLRFGLEAWAVACGLRSTVCIRIPRPGFAPAFACAAGAGGGGFDTGSGGRGAAADNGQQPPLTPMPRGWRLAGVLLLLATTGIGLGWWQSQSMRRLREAPAATIAVLTFDDAGGSAEADPLCEQMAEGLSTRLSLIPGLHVIDRKRLSAFGSKGPSLDELAAVLQASMLVEGSIRRQGQRLRVTARLVSVRHGATLWAESYERTLPELFAVQDEITHSIAGALRVRSSTPRTKP